MSHGPLYAWVGGLQDGAMQNLRMVVLGVAAAASLVLVSCNKKATGESSGPGAQTVVSKARAGGPGRIAYMLPQQGAYAVEARAGASPVDVSEALNKLSKGKDETIHLSRDGTWFALTTERFGCDGWACLAVVTGDLTKGEKVQPGGDDVHPEGPVAIAPSGAAIVYGQKGPHERDLFLTRREGNRWSSPTLLTGPSKFAYNAQPAFSHNGTKVVFDCGTEPYGQEGTGICEVGADGSGYRQVLTPGAGWASNAKAMHHADYAPDGSIVFEADMKDAGEGIWRLPAGQSEPSRLGSFGNDNSPCVLPDGRVVSLWLQRPGGKGEHEIKVMAGDGSADFMAVTGVDVLDSQISCGW